MDRSMVEDVDVLNGTTAGTPSGLQQRGGARTRLDRATAAVVGVMVGTLGGAVHPRRDERGLSQSTENAILLAGAAAIALTIITVITAYVKQRLPR